MQTQVVIDDSSTDVRFDGLLATFSPPPHATETRAVLHQMDILRGDMVEGRLLNDPDRILRLAGMWYRLGTTILASPDCTSTEEYPKFCANDVMSHTCWKLECMSVILNAGLCVERYCATQYYPTKLSFSCLTSPVAAPTLESPVRWLKLAIALLYWARYSIADTCFQLLPGSEAMKRVMSNSLLQRLRADLYIVSAMQITLADTQTNSCTFMRMFQPLADGSARAKLVSLCFVARYHRFRREKAAELETHQSILNVLPQVSKEWRLALSEVGLNAGKEVDSWFNEQEAAVRSAMKDLSRASDSGTKRVGPALVRVHDMSHYGGHDVLQWSNAEGVNQALDLSLNLELVSWAPLQLHG